MSSYGVVQTGLCNCVFAFYLQDYQEELRLSQPAVGQSSGAEGVSMKCTLSALQHRGQQLFGRQSGDQLLVLVQAEEGKS